MADHTRYAFIREGEALAGGSQHYVVPDGYGGVLVSSDDPHLDQTIAHARQLGIKAGIWVPSGGEGGDPEAYATKLYTLAQQYGPDLVVPDLESGAKGAKGSAQWDWNQKFAEAWHALAPDQQTAITVMPNQDDFNYGAYTQYGIPVWAQAYGADPSKDLYDPQQVYQRLIDNGVPPEQASVVLAPGQQYTGQGGAAYALEDFGRGAPVWTDAQPASADASSAATPAAHPGTAAAESYAQKRLQQAINAGLIGGVTPGAGGYAEAWRQFSSTLKEPAEAAGYRDPGYWLRLAGAQHTLSPQNPAAAPPAPAAPTPPPVAPPAAATPAQAPGSALAAARARILEQLTSRKK